MKTGSQTIDLRKKSTGKFVKDLLWLLNPLTSIPYLAHQSFATIASLIVYPATYHKNIQLIGYHHNGETLFNEKDYHSLEKTLEAYQPFSDALVSCQKQISKGRPTFHAILRSSVPIPGCYGWDRLDNISKQFSDINKEQQVNGQTFLIKRKAQTFLVDGFWGAIFGKNALDSETLKPTCADDNNDANEHVFYFGGNGSRREEMYGSIHKDIINAKKANINIIAHTMNPSGVGRSTGRIYTFSQLVNESEQWIKHFIETEKVNPKSITLKTHSLGAAVATIVADRLHKQGYPVNLHHGRSFSELIKIPLGWRKINNPFARGLMRILSWISGWNINVTKAYQDIPEEYKRHHLLKRGGRHLADLEALGQNKNTQNIKVEADEMIPYESSIHYALKPQHKKDKALIDLFRKHLTTILTAKEVKHSTLLALLSTTNPPESLQEEIAFIKTHKATMTKWFNYYARECNLQYQSLFNNSIKDINHTKMFPYFNYLYFMKFKANKFHSNTGHNTIAEMTKEIHSFSAPGVEGTASFNQNEFFIEHLQSKRAFFKTVSTQSNQEQVITTQPIHSVTASPAA